MEELVQTWFPRMARPESGKSEKHHLDVGIDTFLYCVKEFILLLTTFDKKGIYHS